MTCFASIPYGCLVVPAVCKYDFFEINFDKLILPTQNKKNVFVGGWHIYLIAWNLDEHEWIWEFWRSCFNHLLIQHFMDICVRINRD